MAWVNGPLSVYHGTDNLSANAIRLYSINPRYFRRNTDFGAGFYVTTVLHQAQQWANQRCRRTAGTLNAEVLQYDLDRLDLETLRHLCFTLDDDDYFDFVAYCRAGNVNHGPSPRTQSYELIYGPVSLWPQKLTIADCDQLLFTEPLVITGFRSPTASHVPSSGRKFF